MKDKDNYNYLIFIKCTVYNKNSEDNITIFIKQFEIIEK